MRGRLAGLILAVLTLVTFSPSAGRLTPSLPLSDQQGQRNATDAGDSLSDRNLTVSFVAGNTEI